MFWKTSSSLEIRRDQVSGAIPSRPFPASTHVGVCAHALCSAHNEPSQVFTWWPKSSQVPVQGASPLCPHPLPPCTSVALSMRLCRFGTWCWGGGWGGGAGRYGSEPPSPTVWRREPEEAPDTLLPGPGLPLPVDLEPACPEEAGQTGTETSRVNWAEGASSRLNLATPFPSGSLGTPSSFQLSADSQCAGVWRGPESGWAHPGSWPPAAGQPEPIGFSVSISALGNGVPWAVKESEEEALERAGASLPPPYAEKAGTPKFPAAPLGGLG